MKVAYIEDDRVWRKSVVELLGYDGFEVQGFEKEPKSLSELSTFDVIIADNRLRSSPNALNGISILNNLRVKGYNGVLILFTSYPNTDLYKLCDSLDVYLISKKDKITSALKLVLKSEEEHSGFI